MSKKETAENQKAKSEEPGGRTASAKMAERRFMGINEIEMCLDFWN